ncbi:DUF4817 domain-containing protein [Trichonephila clavipes]|nr:DUF4817 domain-containing protein [Trichonephila clavipes]
MKSPIPINAHYRFRHCYGRKPPDAKSTKRWFEMFKETGNVKDPPRSSQSSEWKSIVEHCRQSFQRSTVKSTCEASREVQISLLVWQEFFLKGMCCIDNLKDQGGIRGNLLSTQLTSAFDAAFAGHSSGTMDLEGQSGYSSF